MYLKKVFIFKITKSMVTYSLVKPNKKVNVNEIKRKQSTLFVKEKERFPAARMLLFWYFNILM